MGRITQDGGWRRDLKPERKRTHRNANTHRQTFASNEPHLGRACVVSHGGDLLIKTSAVGKTIRTFAPIARQWLSDNA